MKGWIILAVVSVVIVGGAAISSHDSSSSASNASAATTANEPNVSVVADKSACIASGVSDYYTGDGKVVFAFMLRNTGGAGQVNVTPVRHYSDGEMNASGMDTMLDVQVPGHTVKRYSSQQMTYKAHEHGIVSCGLMLDSGDEIPIPATGF
jgi:uncharacterized secreted protein with C-terminal beta-propeller domain